MKIPRFYRGSEAAVHNDTEAQTMFFDWAVSNSKSNKVLCNRKGIKQEYLGIGGHLFAIAVNASMEAGYDGIILGIRQMQSLWIII